MDENTVEVVVGVIGRAHGIRGDVTIDVRTDEPERRFAPGQVLRDEKSSRAFTVLSARQHSGRLLVTFDGFADRNAVEAVRGVRLVVAVDADESPAEPEEFYDRQLVGLTVHAADDRVVGTVSAVIHLPIQDLLELNTDEGLRLVPFVTNLVPEVDLTAGLVRLADVPGLLSDEDDA
jgi:16S rRNA processing protein RimM